MYKSITYYIYMIASQTSKKNYTKTQKATKMHVLSHISLISSPIGKVYSLLVGNIH